MGKEEDYKEMFIAEAIGNYEELNRLFTVLEKNIADKNAANHIFRITHTLKGNAMGMGFNDIADLAHVMEDVFGEVKAGRVELDETLFNNLFTANDKLGLLIDAITSGEKVSYKGIRTKLSVFLKNARNDQPISQPEIKPDVLSDAPKEVLTEKVTAPLVEQSEDQLSKKINPAEEVVVAEDPTVPMPEEIEDAPKITMSDLVQVPVRKLDSLMNLVGELIIERDSLIAKNAEYGLNANMFARLQRISSDLQYGVMDVRLVQIGFMFNKFHRIVRDVSKIENKQVNLELEGTEIEIDRNILKIMSDSMIHLVRNSISHGIELPADRLKKGKRETGTVTLAARNEKDAVIIEIKDDGNGIHADAIAKKAIKMGIVSQQYIDQATEDEKIRLIFEPGFSNMDQVTSVSGRGVGMDVVKKATESIGGKVEVLTEVGRGTTFRLNLPSSMTVKGALLFLLGNQEYAVGLSYTEAVISYTKKDIHQINSGLMAYYLGKTISVIFLKDIFCSDSFDAADSKHKLLKTYETLNPDHKLDVLVVSYNNKFVGIVVDKLLQQKEVVEKTLAPPLHNIQMISGATILGNGNVCLMIDIPSIVSKLFFEKI